MVCPYCKKQINESNIYCPECGQRIENSEECNSVNSFWRMTKKENEERYQKYKEITDQSIIDIYNSKRKLTIIAFVVLFFLCVSICGGIQYNSYENKMKKQVLAELPGKTFTAHSTHMEGLGWIHHEYKELSFKDEKNVDYSYLETVGPREDNEIPKLEGTFEYTISRTITGNYVVNVNGMTYKLKVDDNNIPIGISDSE